MFSWPSQLMPRAAERAAGEELHEADAALQQPPRQQTAAAEVGRLRLVEAVQRLRRGRLAGRGSSTSGTASCILAASS